MIRITKLVGKSEIFNILTNPDVSKIELLHSQNASLKNPDICRVNIYIRMKIDSLCSIVGNCKELHKKHKGWKKGNSSYVSGICTVLQSGFIKRSTIRKLEEIEISENIKFGIPKHYNELISKFDHYKDAS